MAGIHRGLNVALAVIGALVVVAMGVHLATSVELVRLVGAVAIVALGWAVIVRLLRQTS